MHLRHRTTHVGAGLFFGLLFFSLALASALPLAAQEGFQSVGDIDVDFLFNYYQQDGENSPVTGGIGTEDMDVISPVIAVTWKVDDKWTLRSDFGIDGITSASVDAMDTEVSSASRQDNRTFLTVTGSRQLAKQTLNLIAGISTEYDYQSAMVGLGWAKDFNQRNTTVSAQVRHFSDTLDLYDIDGVNQGDDDRTTTDLTLGLTQVLGPRTVFSGELYFNNQSGYLGTPFHEVILQDGSRVTERLPEDRTRSALGLWLNHAFTDRFVGRIHYRFYDDDWGIQAHTIELEPQFKIGERSWIFPILRFHSQDGADYFGLPFSFDGSEDFITADRDLSEFTSEKFGIGYRTTFAPGRQGWTRRMRSFETRISVYNREDGLESTSASFAWGWRF